MKQLQTFDIFFFTLLAVVSEVISTVFFDIVGSGFYLSFSLLIVIIMIFRWGFWGIVPSLAVGIAAMVLAKVDNFAIATTYYLVAQLFVVLPLVFFGKRNRNKIVENNVFYVLAILLIHLSLCVGKGLSLLIIFGEWSAFLDFFASILFTLAINTLILLLLKKRKGLIFDMRFFEERENDEF